MDTGAMSRIFWEKSVPGRHAEIPGLQCQQPFYEPRTASCYHLEDSSPSGGAGSKEQQLLTQSTPRSSQIQGGVSCHLHFLWEVSDPLSVATDLMG